MRLKVYKLYTTRLTKKDNKSKEQIQEKYKNTIK